MTVSAGLPGPASPRAAGDIPFERTSEYGRSFFKQPCEIGVVGIAEIGGDLCNGEPGIDEHSFGFEDHFVGDEVGDGLASYESDDTIEISLAHEHHFGYLSGDFITLKWVS